MGQIIKTIKTSALTPMDTQWTVYNEAAVLHGNSHLIHNWKSHCVCLSVCLSV